MIRFTLLLTTGFAVLTAVAPTASAQPFTWRTTVTVPAGLAPDDFHAIYTGTGGTVAATAMVVDPNPAAAIAPGGAGNQVDITWPGKLVAGNVFSFRFTTNFRPVDFLSGQFTNGGNDIGAPIGPDDVKFKSELVSWAGCLTCDVQDDGCSAVVTSDAAIEEEDNFVPKMNLALVQAGDKINGFQAGVRDILAKLTPPPVTVQIATVQDAIAAILANPGSNVVIFGHGAQASFKIGEDDLANSSIQSKFLAAVTGQMASLTLFGCSVSQGPAGQDFLKKITAALGIKVKTWGSKVYAFGNDVTIPAGMQNRFFVTSLDDKKEIPTVSEWGLVVMALMVLAAGTIMMTRRRTAVA